MTRTSWRPLSCVTARLGLAMAAGGVWLWPAPPSLGAQPTGYGPVEHAEVRLTATKPFHLGNRFGLAASLLEVGVSLPVRPRIAFTGAVGLSLARSEARPWSLTTSNPRLELHFGDGSSYATIGFSAPLAERVTEAGYAAQSGLEADLERPETFVPDMVAVEGTFTRSVELAAGWRLGGRVGLALLTPRGQDGDPFLRSALFGDRPLGAGRVGAELSGAAALGGAAGGVGGATVFHLALYLELPDGAGAPAVFLRLPADTDTQQLIEAVLGLRLTF